MSRANANKKLIFDHVKRSGKRPDFLIGDYVNAFRDTERHIPSIEGLITGYAVITDIKSGDGDFMYKITKGNGSFCYHVSEYIRIITYK